MNAQFGRQAGAVEVSGAPERVIGIAASAGGLEPLCEVVAGLGPDLPVAVCVVLHIPPTSRSLLAPILDRESALDAVRANDGDRLRAGVIYVAPPDRHLLVGAETIELSRGAKENGVRPAADPLFRSLARNWGPAAIGVVLSGALDDGAAGAKTLADSGGVIVVQSPADALVSSMPASAIAAARPEHVLPAAEIGLLLRRLVLAGAPERTPMPVAEPDPVAPRVPVRPDGAPSGFTCPECHGPLWEQREADQVRYRCRVGHVYSEDAMVIAQGDAVEAALWTALEVLEERSELLQRVAGRMAGATRSAARLNASAAEARERAALIRRALGVMSSDAPPAADDRDEATA